MTDEQRERLRELAAWHGRRAHQYREAARRATVHKSRNADMASGHDAAAQLLEELAGGEG